MFFGWNKNLNLKFQKYTLLLYKNNIYKLDTGCFSLELNFDTPCHRRSVFIIPDCKLSYAFIILE